MAPNTPKPALVRRAMLAIGLATALSLLGDSSLYTILPLNTAEVGVTTVALGALLSANRWVRLLSNNLAGWLADRWARRPVFLLAMAIGTTSTLLYAVANGYWPLLIARIMWGIAWSGIWVVGNAIVLDISDETNRGRLLGVYNVAFSVGAATGSGLGGILNDWLGYRSTVTIEGILTGLGLLIAVLLLPETGGFREALIPASAVKTKAVEDKPLPARSLSAYAIVSIILVFALYGANRIVGAGMFFPTFSLFVTERFGETISLGSWQIGSGAAAGMGQSVSTLLGLAIIPAAGILSDRVRNRWQVATLTIVPAIIGLWLLPLGQLVLLLLAVPLIAITLGSVRSVTSAILGDVAPQAARGKVMGFLFTVGDLASAVGPLIAFRLLEIRDLTFIYHLAAAIFGAILIPTLFLALRRTHSW
ncbi:MAG: MFS transporter [Anaerolineales bacterium]|nr:MFS transporter [Anaerolineales bacterium]